MANFQDGHSLPHLPNLRQDWQPKPKAFGGLSPTSRSPADGLDQQVQGLIRLCCTIMGQSVIFKWKDSSEVLKPPALGWGFSSVKCKVLGSVFNSEKRKKNKNKNKTPQPQKNPSSFLRFPSALQVVLSLCVCCSCVSSPPMDTFDQLRILSVVFEISLAF